MRTRLVGYLREQGYDWDEELVRAAAPLVQEKIAKLGEFPASPASCSCGPSRPRWPPERRRRRAPPLEPLEPFTPRDRGGTALRGRGLEPFQPERIAVTGSKVSPGLFESLELLAERARALRAGAAASGLAGERVERPLEGSPRPQAEARRRAAGRAPQRLLSRAL